MKKIIFIAATLILSSFSVTAYAGSLNSYEAEVVAAAQGVFESDGIKYKLDASYISQLTSYLSSDEVDLTQEQRDQALAAVNDYIDQGIKEGYLVPLDEQTLDDPEKDATEEEKTDTKEIDTDQDTKTSDAETESSKTSDVEKNEKPDGENTKAAESTENSKSTKNTAAKTNSKNALDEDASGNTVPVSELTQAPGEITNEDEIIKNTGFNFNRTVGVAVGIGVLMMIVILVTYRHNFFAQSDE